MIVVQEERAERIYTKKEVADWLGIQENSIAGYISKGKIRSSVRDSKGFLAFTRADLLAYAEKHGIEPPPEEEEEEEPMAELPLLPPLSHLPEPPEEEEEEELLTRVMAQAFAFLRRQGMSSRMLGLFPAPMDFRLWEFQSPSGNLHILTRGQEILIVAEGYQRRQEETIADLTLRLRKAEMNLTYLRRKPRQVDLAKYSRPVMACIEPHQEGFLAWTPEFPDIAARGASEEEAIMHLRGSLKGHAWYLRTSAADISQAQKEEYPRLRSLFLESEEGL